MIDRTTPKGRKVCSNFYFLNVSSTFILEFKESLKLTVVIIKYGSIED